MKLIIAGSRNIDKYRAFWEAVANFGIGYDEDFSTFDCNHFDISEFVTGDCPTGADQVPYMVDKLHNYQNKTIIKQFPADWNKFGRSAGPVRNGEMAEYGDALLLIWDGKSRGSANMKKEMEKLGKPVHEIIISVDEDDI